MITCKGCKKFAKVKMCLVNGLDEVKLIGSRKFCGYDEPKVKKGTPWSEIPESRVDYTDWEELGIDR
jgi:hypothetical protein